MCHGRCHLHLFCQVPKTKRINANFIWITYYKYWISYWPQLFDQVMMCKHIIIAALWSKLSKQWLFSPQTIRSLRERLVSVVSWSTPTSVSFCACGQMCNLWFCIVAHVCRIRLSTGVHQNWCWHQTLCQSYVELGYLYERVSQIMLIRIDMLHVKVHHWPWKQFNLIILTQKGRA